MRCLSLRPRVAGGAVLIDVEHERVAGWNEA